MKSLKLAGAWSFFLLALTLSFVSADANAQSLENTNPYSRFQKSNRQGFGKHRRLENVEKSVTKTTNGIVITMTSEDEDTVTKLQDKEPRNRNDEVTTTKINLSNGVQVTKTSTDSQTVERWHERIDKMEAKKAAKASITRTNTNLSNGVQVTITSTDSDVVEKIQAREDRPSRNDEITKTKVNLTNGVQITITSDDAELVEKIQERAEKGKEGRRGFGKHRRGGRRGFGRGKRGQRRNADQ